METKPKTYKTKDGYIQEHQPSHPKARYGFVLQHILVMEEYLGRPIPAGCHVHHRNLKRHDNKIENLLLMKSSEAHAALHRALTAENKDFIVAIEKWSLRFMEALKKGLPEEDCFKIGEENNSRDHSSKNSSQPKFIVRKK